MTREPRHTAGQDGREARLKAALRANLARRKAQGRARAEDAPGGTGNEQHGPQTPDQGAAGNEE